MAELRTYQSLPQPTKEIVKELEEFKNDQNQTPSNDIKPYIWYNRAQDLASNVDLSNFPSQAQTEVAKFYPEAVVDNPTYTPQSKQDTTISQPDTPQPTPTASA